MNEFIITKEIKKEFIVIREKRQDGTHRNVMLCKSATQAFDFVEFAKEYFGLVYYVGFVTM